MFYDLRDCSLLGKLGGSGITPIQTRSSYPCNLLLISQHPKVLISSSEKLEGPAELRETSETDMQAVME